MAKKKKPACREVKRIPISKIKPNPNQPRTEFDELLLGSLAASYDDRGDVECPISVTKRKEDDGKYFYLIIDGERRYRAACRIGLDEISCFIYEDNMTDSDVYLASVISNLNRESMSPIEEAKAIKKLMDDRMLTQAEVSRKLGITAFRISNILKYLKLNQGLQSLVQKGEIKRGYALSLASYPQEYQEKLFQKFRMELIKSISSGKNGNKRPDANRLLKKLANQLKIKPIQGKKSRKQLNYHEMVLKNVSNKLEALFDALGEFNELKPEEIQDENGYENLINLESFLKKVLAEMKKTETALGKLA